MFGKNKNIKKLNSVLGLEISENSVVVVEVKFDKDSINILNGFRIDVPVFQDINQTISLLNQNLKLLGIKTRQCAFAFTMQYFKLFPVPIPKTIPQDEINSIIIQEGNIAPETDTVSWLALYNTQRVDPDGIERYDVLGISISNKILEASKIISESCGLKLTYLTPAFLCLGVFLPTKQSNTLISSLWMSQIKSEFVAWSGQEPIYEHLFLSHQLNDQVFQSVNYIQTQLFGAKVSNIFTCGPFATNADLSQLPYDFKLFQLPENVIDSGSVLSKNKSSDVVVPIGACLLANGIISHYPNLLLSQKTQKRKDIKQVKLKSSHSSKYLDPYLALFVYSSVFLVLISVLLSVFVQNVLMPNVDKNQSNYENRILLSQSHLAKAISHEKTNKILTLKVNHFAGLIDKRKPWSSILREIGDMTPKGMWIDRLEIKNQIIDIFGRALSVDSVANFSINLNYTAMMLTNAQIISLRKFEEEGIEIIEFQVQTRLKNLINSNKDQLVEKTKKYS